MLIIKALYGVNATSVLWAFYVTWHIKSAKQRTIWKQVIRMDSDTSDRQEWGQRAEWGTETYPTPRTTWPYANRDEVKQIQFPSVYWNNVLLDNRRRFTQVNLKNHFKMYSLMEKLGFVFFFLSVTKAPIFLGITEVLSFSPLLFLHLGNRSVF